MMRGGNTMFEHVYDVRVRRFNTLSGKHETLKIEVFANNRTQAASKARALGYQVLDMNMSG